MGAGAVTAPYDVTDSLVGLGRTLRHAGVEASADRVQAAVRAVEALDRTQYYRGLLGLPAVAVRGPDDVPRFDRVFEAWFGDRPRQVARQQRIQLRKVQTLAEASGEGELEEREGGQAADVPAASTLEQLRERDVGRLTPHRARPAAAPARPALAGGRAARLPPPPSGGPRRRRPRPHAARRAARRRRAGPAAPPARRPSGPAASCCSSTSAARWTSTPTRCCASPTRPPAAARPTEVFALGTRLTRLTRELSLRDPDAAMAAVAAALPDAGGGTRLGDLLKEFLDRWGQRGTARGAVVVVLSDGWERGDATLLGEQMARLQRLAHRVVWSNPRKAAPGYAPLAAGHGRGAADVDDFVEGHSLAALEQLADVVLGRAAGDRAGQTRRHA